LLQALLEDLKISEVSEDHEVFQVFVLDIHNKNRAIATKSDESVRCFKQKVEEKTGIPSDEQLLILKQFDDKLTLTNYNVQRDSTIHLVLRLLVSMMVR